MPLQLKGTLKPGEADRRYYMIRVQVDGRRVVVSANTQTRPWRSRRRRGYWRPSAPTRSSHKPTSWLW